MKTKSLALLTGLSLAAAGGAGAAVHAVLPGGSIQAKIDAAAAGDVIAIFGGAYPEDVTVNKGVRLAEVDGEEVTITGNVTFETLTDPPPFVGFVVGSSGKGVTVNDCTGLVIKDCVSDSGFGLRVNGASDVSVIGGKYEFIDQKGGSLATSDVSVDDDFIANVDCEKTVAFRTAVYNDVTWVSKKAYFGYSSAYHFTHTGSDCKIVVVGSTIDGRNYAIYPGGNYTSNWRQYYRGLYVAGDSNHIFVANNIVKGIVYGGDRDPDPLKWYITGRGIQVAGADNHIEIHNNYIGLYNNRSNTLRNQGRGIEISGGNPTVRIYNNIIWGAGYSIYAPYGSEALFNCSYAHRYATHGAGVVPVGTITANPLFIAGTYELEPESPCRDAGTPNPLYNDLDGSRNDIGPTGGCFFDPDAKTTSKPVVIAFDLAPRQLLKGVDTEVQLSEGQAIAQP